MSENTGILLETKDLSKYFTAKKGLLNRNPSVVKAVDHVSLSVRKGETLGLVGESGCGKSTILRLVAGLITPTLGTVSVNGAVVEGPDPNRGMVFQKPTLFPWLTVEKNIAFSLEMQGKLKGNEEKVQRMLNIIGLEQFKDDYPGQLSGGMAREWLWSVP
mgnify:CR=1 FL=1